MPKVVSIPFTVGRKDKIDPKLAPFGVLKEAKNLRVRKDGRLGVRGGYQPLSMVTKNGTLSAFDLHEYKSRLVALGSDGGDGFPTDTFEYTNASTSERWRGTDRDGQRVTLNPFTGLREIAGIPLPEAGITKIDAAAGGGHVCMAYVAEELRSFAIIVDIETDQTIHQQDLTSAFGAGVQAGDLKVVYAGGRFYIGARLSSAFTRIIKYKPGTDTGFSSHVTSVGGIGGSSLIAWDMVAVTHSGTTELLTAYRPASTNDVTVKGWDSSGAQTFTAITVSGIDPQYIAIEGDEADDTINLLTYEPATTSKLRTYDFSGALVTAATALSGGTTGSLCRLPAQGSIQETVAVVSNISQNTFVEWIAIGTHATTASVDVHQSLGRGRPVPAQSANHDLAIAFPALVAPDLSTLDDATNALFFVTPDVAHMTTRDFIKAKDRQFCQLTVDDTTGLLCWPATRDPGVASSGVPVTTVLKFQDTGRRQAARYGGLLYTAGSVPSIYDGRISVEAGFNEAPGITTVTPSNSTGALTPGARYDYVAHWEYGFADGSVISSAPSLVKTVTMGASDDTNTVVVTTPHTVRIAMGDILFGCDVSAVISRTEWTPVLTTAELFSGSLAPLSGVLEDLTFIVFVDGGGAQTVTFTLGATNLAAVVSEINAGTTGLTASQATAGSTLMSILDDTAGSGGTLTVGSGTANTILGFFDGQTSTGTTGGLPGSIYRRAQSKPIPVGFGRYGNLLTFTDVISDTDLADEEVIYTQAARGALSGPLEHDAPQACEYLVADSSRITTGGLTRPHEFQVSKEAFLGEPFAWSEFSTFFGQVNDRIKGVESLDGVKLLFTGGTIFAVPGDGPDDQGGGELGLPSEITTPAGLKSWQSFLKVPEGLFFQLDDSKLFRMPRGAGSPEWAAADIEDLLLAYPDIVGTAKHKGDNVGVFAANSNNAQDARLAILDFRTQLWTHDTPVLQASEGIEAITTWGDTLAYTSGGVVYRQVPSFVDGTATFIVTELETHPLFPFGPGGYGLIQDFLLTAEYRGACTLNCRVSLDEGLTFTTLTSFALTGLTVGQTVQRRWALPQTSTGSLIVEFTTSDLSGATEGLVYNQLDLLVEPETGLRELLPAEAA